MTPKSVYDWFALYFPHYVEHVESWKPNPHEKNSVVIKQTNSSQFVFSYKSKFDWRFETLKSYTKNLKCKGD